MQPNLHNRLGILHTLAGNLHKLEGILQTLAGGLHILGKILHALSGSLRTFGENQLCQYTFEVAYIQPFTVMCNRICLYAAEFACMQPNCFTCSWIGWCTAGNTYIQPNLLIHNRICLWLYIIQQISNTNPEISKFCRNYDFWEQNVVLLKLDTPDHVLVRQMLYSRVWVHWNTRPFQLTNQNVIWC